MNNIITIILLLVSGFMFLLIEFFLIPGFGIVGFLGLALLVLASYIALQLSLTWGIVTSVISLISFVLFIIYLRKSYFWNRIKMKKSITSRIEDKNCFLGKTGTALTPLRPSGAALIEGHRLDVLTDGTFIEKDTNVKVVKIEGNKIIVIRSKL